MSTPKCPYCHDDVSIRYDYCLWRCPACGGIHGDEYEEDLQAERNAHQFCLDQENGE